MQISLRGQAVQQVGHFKYLGSFCAANLSMQPEISNSLVVPLAVEHSTGYPSWMSGGQNLFQKGSNFEMIFYKVIVQSALLYRCETQAFTDFAACPVSDWVLSGWGPSGFNKCLRVTHTFMHVSSKKVPHVCKMELEVNRWANFQSVGLCKHFTDFVLYSMLHHMPWVMSHGGAKVALETFKFHSHCVTQCDALQISHDD